MSAGRIPTTANSPLTTKGDLFSYSTAPARLAVGSNGDTIVADSSTATGLAYKEDYAAGKNKIINGDFGVNQRGFTSGTVSGVFNFDRFSQNNSDGTCTASAQTFTPGAAPVAGYEAANYFRFVTTGQTATSALAILTQRIEDVRTFAGQTVTVSFYAQAGSGTPSMAIELDQQFGSGGSTRVTTLVAKKEITTSWVRYSASIAVPSISGKTIGTGSYLSLGLWVSAGSDFNARTSSLGIQSNTFNIWGVQVEDGSVATAFQTATGSIQGELAAAQRYYYRANSVSLYGYMSNLITATASTRAIGQLPMKVTMRTTPTAIDFSAVQLSADDATITAVTSVTIMTGATPDAPMLSFAVASGLTQFRPYFAGGNNSTSAFIGLSAEL